MTAQDSIRKTALRLLAEAEERASFVNLLLSDRVLTEAGEGKGLLTALVYGTTERRLTLDYLIGALSGRGEDAIKPRTRALLRPALYELLYLHTPAHAAVNEWVSLAKDKGERGFVNALLREADRRRDALPFPPKEKTARYLSVTESFPLSTVKRLLSLLGGEETAALLAAFNRVAPLSVCLSSSLNREEYIASLTARGIRACATPYSARGVLLPDGGSPTALPLFAEGELFVQDEASMLAAEALYADAPAPTEDELTVDVCACPGGKSFGAALLRGRVGRRYAFDLHESKLSLVSEGAKRLGIPLSVAAVDATVGEASLDGQADFVICDVPCSGLGVLGKKPDLRYRIPTGELPALQAAILGRAFLYLKVGGTLLYSTCTLLPEENEEVVQAFLAAHPEAEAVDFRLADGRIESKDGTLTLYPHRHGTDGFFLAKLRRTK